MCIRDSSITVADLSEETFNILHPDSQVVCQVKMSRVSLSIDEEEGDEDELEEGAEGAEGAEGTKENEGAKPAEGGQTPKGEEAKSDS